MSVLQPPVMTLLKRRHIVSPRDGKLVEGARQISVVTTNGAIGEILSTALFAADSEQTKSWWVYMHNVVYIYIHHAEYILTVLDIYIHHTILAIYIQRYLSN